jgi:hypothetical protein
METIVLKQQKTEFNHLSDHLNHGFSCQGLLNEKNHSIDIKNSVDTIESHSRALSENSME